MREEDMTRLVSAVTEQVLRALSQGGAAPAADDGLPCVLALGDAARLPGALTDRSRVLTIEDYCRCGNIKKYKSVLIGSMTTLQLSSLALGLPADDFCRAVMEALLNGVEVCMLQDAPEHRACAGRGSAALVALLEDYVRKLMVFGVRLVDAAACRPREAAISPPVPPAQRPPMERPECHARPNGDRLVTEADALRLCASAQGPLRLSRGTLITPAARDAFAAAGITVVIE